MKALDKYNEALNEVYNYFGFTPDWVVYPIDDRREYLWQIIDNEVVKFGESLEVMNSDGNYYEQDIYRQRFYKKHIYEGPEYTMIFVDTRTDGMKYFAIYDNKKRIAKLNTKGFTYPEYL